MLEVSFDRPSGAAVRIGRAPKRYRTSDLDVDVTPPERHYDFVAEILLDAVERSCAGDPASQAVTRVAFERGRDLGAEVRSASDASAPNEPWPS